MAVNLDQILFYNPPQPKARRRANLSSEGAVGHSSQSATCIDLGRQQGFLGSIEISDDEVHCAVARGLSSPGHISPSNEAGTRSASVGPGAPTSPIEVPSHPSSQPIPHPIPATTSAPLGDDINGDVTGRPICESVGCGRSDSSTAGVTETCHSVVPVGSSPLRPLRKASADLGQTTFVGTNARVEERLALSTQPGRCATSHVQVAVESAELNPPFADQSSTSLDELFPNLSSLSGSPLMTNPKNPIRIYHRSVRLPGGNAPSSAVPGVGATSLGGILSLRNQPQAPSSPVAFPGRSRQNSQVDGLLGDQPVTPPGKPGNNSFAPPPKQGRQFDRNGSRPQRCSARLRSTIHQAPTTYHEASDSSSDASGGEESYTPRSPDREREHAPGSKRRRSSKSSEAVGPRRYPRRRVAQSSANMTSSRQVRNRGIISPPLSRYPSEPGSVEDGPITTFQEWPLEGATLKRVVEGGVATFQLQFSWDLCTERGNYVEAPPKGRTPLSAKGRGPFTADEDAMLIKLKEQGISWKEIHGQFAAIYPGRTSGALQVRYCTKLKDRQE
jgi:hypothetical protein